MAIFEAKQQPEIAIRVYFKEPSGQIKDGGISYELSSFAGQVPCIGDTIIDPGVLQNLDRYALENREFWVVVDRVYGAMDQEDSIALVVQVRETTRADAVFVEG